MFRWLSRTRLQLNAKYPQNKLEIDANSTDRLDFRNALFCKNEASSIAVFDIIFIYYLTNVFL